MAAPELRPAPDLLADGMDVLLHDIDGPDMPSAPGRGRLLARVARSAAAARRLHTRRHDDMPVETLADGVRARELYRAPPLTLRPGEPKCHRLIEVAPGAHWACAPGPWQREWLVLGGAAALDGLALHTHDFLLQPPGVGATRLHSEGGALLLLREAPPQIGTQPLLQRAADASWGAYGPGIERRLMWQHEGQAAMLYRTEPGAAVPRHGHRHDEECLMLAGDIFLDEVLLRPLDYQLAPAGTRHDSVGTDTGLLLYAHGDLDLDLQP